MLDRPSNARGDPLSDVLALTDARCLFSALFSAGGAWSRSFAAVPAGIKFGAVLRGTCWLVVDGFPPSKLESGDCYLLTTNRSYVLASDPGLEPVEFEGALHAGIGSDVQIAGGRFVFDGLGASLLLNRSPPMFHVPAGSDAAGVLSWVLQQLRSELIGAHAGRTLMAEYLARMMFVQMLRVQLAAVPKDDGWLGALADPRIGEAIRRIHEAPTRRWTVDDLARGAGLTRSTFAARFKHLVGSAPLEYVICLRLQVAAHALLVENATIATIAGSFGYESESAFSNAFKRVMGAAPSHYRAARKALRPATTD